MAGSGLIPAVYHLSQIGPELRDGAAKLSGGTDTLAAGAGKLSNAAGTLAEGTRTFRK